jgi:CDP-paratose 2-epimerase
MRVFVTGGAGFIGCNTVRRLLERGDHVLVYDNLSRRGAKRNLDWLKQFGKFEFVQADVRDYQTLSEVFLEYRQVDAVIHLASQVAVTTSVQYPREDFEINALGTFNLLEAVRNSPADPVVIYASTNKVYGGMEDVQTTERDGRHCYADLSEGLPETRCTDFHSPYGCSKGAGDQYARDYARIYGMKTVVFRQSCIYGPRQFGVEDQGWLAWFTIAALMGKPITIYGDGKQVRDILWVDDLLNAYLLAIERGERVAGRIYNIGGGPRNALAIWSDCGPILEQHLGKSIEVSFDDWRPGDQVCCICDIRRAKKDLGWEPRVGYQEGIERLFEWVRDNLDIIREELAG